MRFARATFHQCWNSLGDDDFKMAISQCVRPTTGPHRCLTTPRILCNYLLRQLSFCAIVSIFLPSVNVFLTHNGVLETHLFVFTTTWWREKTRRRQKLHDVDKTNTTVTQCTRCRQNQHTGKPFCAFAWNYHPRPKFKSAHLDRGGAGGQHAHSLGALNDAQRATSL